MKLAVISLKKSWADPSRPGHFVTVGGFPQQMAALSALFSETVLYLPQLRGAPPPNAAPLAGHNLRVQPLSPLPERGWRRKLSQATWLPRNLGLLWRGIRAADAVHTPVPGDVATVGLLLALAQRKRLFVRYCTVWGRKYSFTARFLLWLLERVAGGRNVVMATGGAASPPSARNPNITWIFSTSLTAAAWQALPQAVPWQRGSTVRLISVGRVEPVKNLAALLQALPAVRQVYPHLHLDVVGEGTALPGLRQQAAALGLDEVITFHGNLGHQAVLGLLGTAHIYLMPSLVEGFPKALLEAMACGLPAVATAVSVIPRLVGTSGVLLPEPTPAAIAAAVTSLLADDARLAAMGRAGRAASQQYTLEGWQQVIGERLAEVWGEEMGRGLVNNQQSTANNQRRNTL